MGPLSMEQVLAEEAARLASLGSFENLRQIAGSRNSDRARTDINADARSGDDESLHDAKRRTSFYCSLNKLNRSALCLSGGGIRGATFCLGVIQGLAAFDTRTGTTDFDEKCSPTPETSLLGRFQFLSTVSGGTYIGAWLSAWLHNEDFPTVWSELISRGERPVEPLGLSWLRAYSNYLSRRVEIDSADWAAAGWIYFRYLFANSVVIVPILSLLLLFPKFVAALSIGISGNGNWWLVISVGLIGVASQIVAQAFMTSHRPTRREPPRPSNKNIGQSDFLKNNLTWAIFSAFSLTIFFSSHLVIGSLASNDRGTVFLSLSLSGGLLFATGWIAGWPVRRSYQDFIAWTISGLIYGTLVGLGAYLFNTLGPYSGRSNDLTLLLLLVFGVPWLLMSQLSAEKVFVRLVSYQTDSISDQLWLDRAAYFVASAALAWAVTVFLAIAVTHYIIFHNYIPSASYIVASIGGVAGIATKLVGNVGDRLNFILKLIARSAGAALIGALIVALSLFLDLLLFGDSLIHALSYSSAEAILFRIACGAIVAAVIGTVASIQININSFSLQSMYQTSLVRGYLGGARPERNPDRLTGFDADDNVQVHALWPPKASAAGSNTYGLFQVINLAFNFVESQRLGLWERRVAPFTVSPLHCGSYYAGFRPSRDYGGPAGISLGTAMAISSAMVDLNLGDYSSRSIRLLLALFNLRPGRWLGNPGPAGEDSYRTPGPSVAVTPLIQEAFGLSTADRSYVYLSGGGQFETLGLYEMVRRRCRFITVVDASEDLHLEFADLGNAIRKIYIDLGIQVRFYGLQLMSNRPSLDTLTDQGAGDIPYHAVGVIEYGAADGAEEGCGDGTILYIKPALHGTEGAGITSYAASHPDFPHETTADQSFTESQFESYRSLGLEITERILRTKIILGQAKMTLQEVLAELPETTMSR
jgi:hypothetical protein